MMKRRDMERLVSRKQLQERMWCCSIAIKKKNSAIDQCPVVRKSTKCLLRIKTTNNHGLNIAGKVSDSPGLI